MTVKIWSILFFIVTLHILTAMTIDPELLRLIQVEGITDEDYRRVQPKIEAVKRMALSMLTRL